MDINGLVAFLGWIIVFFAGHWLGKYSAYGEVLRNHGVGLGQFKYEGRNYYVLDFNQYKRYRELLEEANMN